MPAASNAATNNESVRQWEMTVNGMQAILSYERHGNRIIYLHTEVPPELEGHGLAGELARAALDDARARHQSVVPQCPFVASFIKRHPEYEDLVERGHRLNL